MEVHDNMFFIMYPAPQENWLGKKVLIKIKKLIEKTFAGPLNLLLPDQCCYL